MSNAAVFSTPPVEATAETFCTYLAKQLVAQRGFQYGTVAEAAPIAEQSDIVLTHSDQDAFVIAGLIDHTTHPDKVFSLTPAEIDAIGLACRKHTREPRIPLIFHLMRVGPTSDEHPLPHASAGDLSAATQARVCTWMIDTAFATVSNDNSLRRDRPIRKFIEQLLRTAPAANIADVSTGYAKRGFPWLTAAILTALAVAFACEFVFGIGESKFLQPTIMTLLALGGLARDAVLGEGQWYRLFAAPFLHLDPMHLAMNTAAIAIAGFLLESLTGRAWFATIYVVSALCGSWLSVMLNPPNIVSVGASGAGMGLFAAMLVISGHFPPSVMRSRLRMNAFNVLVPSLLPFLSIAKGVRVDYAAHFGGALGGAALAGIVLLVWRRTETRPRFRTVALVAAIAGWLTVAAAAIPVRLNYPDYVSGFALIPDTPASQLVDWEQLDLKRATSLANYFPHEPRFRYIRALRLVDAGYFAQAERELKAALVEEAHWRLAARTALQQRPRVLLAWVLIQLGRTGEAKEAAAPLCRKSSAADVRDFLKDEKLCTN